jgi:hypothetical protein
MQVGPNQLASCLASCLLKSRFRRLQLNAIAQEHLAGQADKLFHRLNSLPFNIDQRLANRVAAPLSFLEDMLAGPEPGGDVLGDRAHLLDDLGLVTERGEDLLQLAIELSEFRSLFLTIELIKRLTPLPVRCGGLSIQHPCLLDQVGEDWEILDATPNF